MITLLLGLFGPLLVFLWANNWVPSNSCYGPCDRGDIVAGVVVLIIITIGCTLIMGLLAIGLGSLLARENTMDDQPSHIGKMISMRNADSVAGAISGGIFMMHGYIGGTQYYHWYEERSNGSFEAHKVEAGQGVYIYEQDRTDGLVQVYQWHVTHPKWAWLFGIYDDGESSGSTHRFYIPKGTIQRDFKLT